MGLSWVPEYRCGAAAARDLTGREQIDGAALGKGGTVASSSISRSLLSSSLTDTSPAAALGPAGCWATNRVSIRPFSAARTISWGS